MRNLPDTIARLAKFRHTRSWGLDETHGRLVELGDFGPNPGDLRAKIHVPTDIQAGAALVIVLHGCTQTAASYDRGSGWSRLADEYGFVLLFPEQSRANNPNLCFNWFQLGDSRRGHGEASSIRQMVASVVAGQCVDPERIFITGLSAGGAMASVMLASYPELFAGGAILAGLSFGTASTIPEAFDRMRGHGGPDPKSLAERVRTASSHRGPWPTISVWHGDADMTVVPSNGDDIVAQWVGVHGIDAAPAKIEMIDGHRHRIWTDVEGRICVEEYRIARMGHGVPLDLRDPAGIGAAGPHMFDVGISSTRLIAQSWGLGAPGSGSGRSDAELRPTSSADDQSFRAGAKVSVPSDVETVINAALRAAGLVP